MSPSLELRPLLYYFKRLHGSKKAMDDLVTYEGYASSYVGVFASDLGRTGAKCWPKQVSDHAAQKLGRPSSKRLLLHPIGLSFWAVLSTTSGGLKMARAGANYFESSQMTDTCSPASTENACCSLTCIYQRVDMQIVRTAHQPRNEAGFRPCRTEGRPTVIEVLASTSDWSII